MSFGSVVVSVVCRVTFRTNPSPHSQTFQALRASALFTAATGLGRESFIDLIEPHAGVIAFVLQDSPKLQPASSTDFAIDVLCMARAFTLRSKIAPLAADEPGAEFLQEVLPVICDFCVSL